MDATSVPLYSFQIPAKRVISISPLIFGCSFVRPFVLVSLSKIVITSPPKPQNGLSPSCSSNHYFFNMSICKSVIVCLIIIKKLVSTSPQKLLNGLSSYFQGMFPQTPSCASSHYFSDMTDCSRISLFYFHYENLVTTTPKY